MFSLFSPWKCILPSGGPVCSLKLTAWGQWVPYWSQALQLSDTTDCNRGVWPIPLMPADTTYMNYACLKWTLRFHIWHYQSFECSFLIQPLHIACGNCRKSGNLAWTWVIPSTNGSTFWYMSKLVPKLPAPIPTYGTGVVYLVTEPGENCVKPVTCNWAVQISVANRLIVADPCIKL